MNIVSNDEESWLSTVMAMSKSIPYDPRQHGYLGTATEWCESKILSLESKCDAELDAYLARMLNDNAFWLSDCFDYDEYLEQQQKSLNDLTDECDSKDEEATVLCTLDERDKDDAQWCENNTLATVSSKVLNNHRKNVALVYQSRRQKADVNEIELTDVNPGPFGNHLLILHCSPDMASVYARAESFIAGTNGDANNNVEKEKKDANEHTSDEDQIASEKEQQQKKKEMIVEEDNASDDDGLIMNNMLISFGLMILLWLIRLKLVLMLMIVSSKIKNHYLNLSRDSSMASILSFQSNANTVNDVSVNDDETVHRSSESLGLPLPMILICSAVAIQHFRNYCNYHDESVSDHGISITRYVRNADRNNGENESKESVIAITIVSHLSRMA